MSKHTRSVLATFAAGALLSACGGGGGESPPPASRGEAPGAAPGGAAPAGSGEFGTCAVVGRVTFQGQPPAAQAIKMDADPYCSLQHPHGAEVQDYVVGADGGLKWVFVYVKEGLAGAYGPPAEPVVLDQKGCTYEPHVFGISVDQKLSILNSDETLHNIHALPKNSRQFNLAMPRAGMQLEQKFTDAEVMVRVKCDVHPWMESWVGVVPHPFHAVTADDGAFRLERLPPGTYTVEAWHEAAGAKTMSVTVAEGETKEVTFAFEAAA
jgi:hypothetical protein